jgi:hypothetical protein
VRCRTAKLKIAALTVLDRMVVARIAPGARRSMWWVVKA